MSSPALATRMVTCRRSTCSCIDERLVMIDLPQIVDIAANPQGATYLHRDCVNVCRWFAAHGVAAEAADPDLLLGDLMAEAVGSW